MNAKFLSTILFLFLSIAAYGQINYSYTDPCTGVIKTMTVPSNGVTVTYYGQVNTFQPADFYNGGFETWAQGVYGSFGGNNPCATVIGLPTGINIAQGTTLNFLSIINSLDAVKDLAGGSTNILSGVDNASKASNGKKESKKNGNSSSNSNSNGSGSSNTTSQSNSGNGSQGQGGQGQVGSQGQTGSSNPGGGGQTGSANPGGGEGQTGSSSTGGSSGGQNGSSSTGGSSEGSGSNGSGNSGGTTEDPKTEEGGGGKTNIIGSTANNVQSASNKNGNRPNVIASSDFVGFNFKNSDVDYGGKFTGGYTSARWDGARAHGVLVDYTTALKGPNISGFYAFIKKRRIDLISTSLTIGFDRKPTVYGTLALGQMWDFGKSKKAKALYMLTASAGSVYGEAFVGTAAIAGAMYDLKIGKRIDIKLMGLYVYAPYVSYYNDILLKSPHVVLPIIGTNIGITKKFKININGGGAWAIQENALNYTVMMGTRFLL
jgi:hypothetical protein